MTEKRADPPPVERAVQCLALVGLVSIPIYSAAAASFGADIWWHLRAGKWVLEHRTVPETDPFSLDGETRPWVLYSWLFDVLVYSVHSGLGLSGLIGLRMLFVTLIVWRMWRLIRLLHPRFPHAAALLLPIVLVLVAQLRVRPWFFSMLFFTIQLELLSRARENRRWLYGIPLLYLLWANIHVQFVYGLGVLGAACVESLLDRFGRRPGPTADSPAPSGRFLLVAVLSVGATLVNPYHVRIYEVILLYAGQSEIRNFISEARPLGFGDLRSWIILACGLGAAFVMGWRRERRPLPYLLLLGACMLSFRMRRDAWVLGIVGPAVLAGFPALLKPEERLRLAGLQRLGIALGIASVAAGFWLTGFVSNESLQKRTAARLPEEAVQELKRTRPPGPLYSHFNWGGFLIWRLPEYPVMMDGRTNVHGMERTLASLRTWRGRPGWKEDPDLERARTVLAPVESPLAQLLRLDPRFKAAYEDKIAVIFLRR